MTDVDPATKLNELGERPSRVWALIVVGILLWLMMHDGMKYFADRILSKVPLAERVAEWNKATPRMVDAFTRVDHFAVSPKADEVVIEYTVLDLSVEEVDPREIAALKERAESETRGDLEALVESIGAAEATMPFHLEYRDKHGKPLFDFVFVKERDR